MFNWMSVLLGHPMLQCSYSARIQVRPVSRHSTHSLQLVSAVPRWADRTKTCVAPHTSTMISSRDNTFGRNLLAQSWSDLNIADSSTFIPEKELNFMNESSL
ncbi:hypothetical protein B0T09DRAFT_347791 [Sordaria sp. MPI-SDFR-AT-0083]|nr:hypothetical protein B0T09DRAFT_347791 [Sordaria sp. MPI-SDFR-AT-0083]